jgi:hypothetical protein
VYEYHQDNYLNALSSGTKVAVHYNEWGVTVGGPVWFPHLYDGRRKKTFFFFSYDGIHNNAPANTGLATVPSALERTGDFSQTCQVTSGIIYGSGNCSSTSNPTQTPKPFIVYDPLTIDPKTGNRTPFQGNVIPANRISPFAKAIFALLPLPNKTNDIYTSSNANNYLKNETQRDKFASYLGRVDQAWNNANHSYVNVNSNDFIEVSLNPFGGFANDILNSLDQARKQRSVTLDHNLVLNPRMVLDLKYSILNSYGNAFSGSAGYDVSTLGLSSNYIGQMFLPSIPLFTGVVNGAENGGLGTANGGSYNSDTFQTISAFLTQSFHNHTFKYGFEHLIQQQAGAGLGAAGGSFSFGSAANTSNDSWTCLNPVSNCGASQGNGSNIAQFLLGLPLSGSMPITSTAFWSQHYTAAYFQDDWRLTSKLTLNIGMRWDFQTGVSERHNKDFSRYDPNYVQTGVTGPSQANYATLVGATSTNAGVQLLQAYRPSAATFISRGAVDFAGVHGTALTPYDPRYKYFQPRLGIAYRVHPNTVIRGGIGRFVQANFDTSNQNGFSSNTNYTATADNFYHPYTNPATGNISTLLNPYPDGLIQPTGNSLAEQTNIGTVTAYTDPRYGRVSVDEASASLQQQVKKFLFEIGGAYSRSRGLALGTPPNAIPPDANIAVPSTHSPATPTSPTPTRASPASRLPIASIPAAPWSRLNCFIPTRSSTAISPSPPVAAKPPTTRSKPRSNAVIPTASASCRPSPGPATSPRISTSATPTSSSISRARSTRTTCASTTPSRPSMSFPSARA